MHCLCISQILLGLFITRIAGQKQINISPFPTATVIENDLVELTCTYSNGNSCPSDILVEWFLNSATKAKVTLLWNGTQCIFAMGDNPLEFNCRASQTKCMFTLILAQVSRSQHGDKWRCLADGEKSVQTTMSVDVPITSVAMTSPTSAEVTVSENVPSTFVCETSVGRPQAAFSWAKQLNSEPAVPLGPGSIQPITSEKIMITKSTLQFVPNRGDHNYRMYCIANNTGPDHTFTSAKRPKLFVQYAPAKGPDIVNHTEGGIFSILDSKWQTLTCSIQGGRPPASLSWNCFNGTVLDESTGTTVATKIKWRAFRSHDKQHCTCRSIHPVGKNSVYVVIKALYPPKTPTFSVNGRSVSGTVSVIEHKNVSVLCNSSGSPPPAYAWTPRGSHGSPTLTLTNAQRRDRNDYSCTATNTMVPSQGNSKNGINTTTISLNVLYAPEVRSLVNDIAVENKQFNKTCIATPGNPATTMYKWTSDVDSTESDGRTLTISKVTKGSAGTYRCTAKNTMKPTEGNAVEGSDWKEFVLTVHYPASITAFTVNGAAGEGPYTYDENSTITFKCEVDSNPGSRISIIRERTALATPENVKEAEHRITKVSYSDAGLYSCKAANQYNGQDSATVERRVFVRCPPRPFSLANNVTHYHALNDIVTMTLYYTAYPYPSGHGWYKLLSDSSWETISSGVSFTNSQSTLTIRNIKAADFGQYEVRVENSMGNLSHKYFIAAQEHPKDDPESGGSGTGVVAAAGGSAAVIVIVIVLIVVITRRKQSFKGKAKKEDGLSDKIHGGAEEDDEDVQTENVNYISADDCVRQNEISMAASGDTYATVNKPKSQPTDIYAQVNKKRTEDAKKKAKKAKAKPPSGDVYENHQFDQFDQSVYENSSNVHSTQAGYNDKLYEYIGASAPQQVQRETNKDGLIYLQLDFKHAPKQAVNKIIGSKETTEYGVIDFKKRAAPLPDSDEEDNSNF